MILHELSAQQSSLEEAVTAERIKLQTTRSPLWTALAVVVLSLGFAAIQAVTALPYSAVPPERAAIGVATFGVPVLMMLSALTITGEHPHRA
jgi:ABC-2 type transport system permease protein